MCEYGQTNDVQLQPHVHCCACNGGSARTPLTADVNLSTNLLCRDSDFRTVAADPYYNVVEVSADVQPSGYLVLKMLKAKPVATPGALETTYLYVLNGWQCKVEFEVELQDTVVTAIIADATPNNY